MVKPRNQGTEESFDSYLAEIRNLAKSCIFCDCMSDSLIRDRIVMGVYDAGTRKHLLQKRQLTLQAAMEICRSDEAVTAQMKSINDSAEIHKIKKSHSGDADRQNSTWKPGNLRSQRTMQRRQNATYSDGDTKRTCKFCGRTHPQKKVCCSAWGRTCRRCEGRNHFSNCCKMGNKKVYTVERCGRTDEESIMALDKGRYTKGPIYAEMWMNDKSVKFQIESRHEVPASVHAYFSMRDELAVSDGLIFRGERVVIPEGMRKLTKECLHRSHLGVESVLRRARECLYWPNMAADIRQVVENCEACRSYERSQQKETLITHETPTL